MRRSGGTDGRWLSAAEQRTAAMRSRSADSAAAAPAAPSAAAAGNGGHSSVGVDDNASWASGPSRNFQVPDGRGSRGAAEAAHAAGASAVNAFPPHAAPQGGANGGSSPNGSDGSAGAGADVLRDAALAKATSAKADVMQSAAQSALGTPVPKHKPGRFSRASEGPPQLAVVYGASTAWPLAHLPNPASHGPAAAALGDSLKAEHHTQLSDTNGTRALKLLLAGGAAGALSRTATAPMDRLRMLQQVHRSSGRLSMRQGLAKMAAEGSVRAFWRGNGANVVKNIPEMGLKLCAADHARQAISTDGSRPTLAQRLAIGGLAGAVAQAAVFPLEVVQTRLAVSPVGTYSGIWDALSKIVGQEGPRALYRGLTPTMCGILPYAGIDIAVFGLLRDHMTDVAARQADLEAVAAAAGVPGDAAAAEALASRVRAQSPVPREITPGEVQPAAGLLLVAGMISSTSAQLVSYPLGLVRTRLQAQGMGGRPVVYKGMLDCFRQILRREGVRGLYKGLLPDMAKIAPAAAISWTVFERGKSWLGVHEPLTRR